MIATAHEARTALVRTLREHPISSGIILCAILTFALWCLLPESHPAREARIAADLAAGRVAQIAKAPDGATVWAVQQDGHTIYFSNGSLAVVTDTPNPR